MKKTRSNPRNLAAGLACTAALLFAGAASAQLTLTTSTQYGSAGVYPFTPTWTPAANSLIAGLAPTVAVGDFGVENTNRNVLSLTAGGSLALYTVYGNADDSTGTSLTTCTNYVTGGNANNSGPEPGSLLVYTLPTSAHGYNLTNITVDGGWADNGRDGQSFMVLYSTVVSPGHFLFLTNVDYVPTVPGSTPVANQEVIQDALGGVIASNVNAVEFILNAPNSENGFVGYGAITVQGTPATVVASPVISVTASNEFGASPFTPDWTLETNSLIANMSPSTALGDFVQENSGGTNVLTDGQIGLSGDITTFATCGANGGTTLIYTLTNNAYGTDLTNIVTYSGWGNDQRSGQYYIVSYATVSAPTTFIPITTVCYNPYTNGTAGAAANRVAIAMSDGSALAKSVLNIKFDFSTPAYAANFNNAYQGYSEIIVQGRNSTAPPPPPSPYLTQDTLPTGAETVAGGQVVFTAAYSNFPPATLEWQQITTSPAATNILTTGVVNVSLNGVTTSTLTLNNVTAANAGTYRLAGLNSTNGSAAPSYSTTASLAVGASTTVGNAVMEYVGETGPVSFYPAWSIATNLDLIFQSTEDNSGNPGTSTVGSGNFAEQGGEAIDPAVLVDGELTNGLVGMVSCGWVNVSAGQSMTYSLPSGFANGYDITNITVYGGGPDDSRNEQIYQVLYSTMAAPTVFSGVIGTFDYKPSFADGGPNATRVTIVPAAGALAHNVYALQFNFNMKSGTYDYNCYSEITVNGKASSGVVPLLTGDIAPLTAEDVVGSQLILTASFTNATSLQWLKNGTSITKGVVVNVTNNGVVTSTLTLNDLQLTDTATNGGYSLVGSNLAGSSASRGCSVKIDQVPAAVGNVVTSFAYQSSDASAPNTFGPTWSTEDLTNSLIYQQNPPAEGYGPNDAAFVGGGDAGGGLQVLTDGNYGVFAFDKTHPAFATCGPNAGQYVIYTLGTNANGYNVTNIQIAGGWNDNGRNSQYYTVYYATVDYTNGFIPITAVEISPVFSAESVIRTTITPAAGVIASNVYALYVDFTQPPGVPNSYSGYSEISVFGSPSTAAETALPLGTIGNPSFELNVAPIGGSVSGAPSYWTSFNQAASGDIGSQAAGGLDYTIHGPLAAPAAGNQYCYINMFTTGVTGGIYQDTGALKPNTTYTLTVAIGSRSDRLNSAGIISLINGTDDTGTVLATGGGLPATRNSWQDYTVTFTTGASVSGDLTVELSVAGDPTLIQADFDNVRLTVGAQAPVLGTARVAGGNLVLTGTGGTPNGGYTWLTTTNLTAPIIWTTNSTGTLDATGSFSNSIPIDPSQPASFFRLRTP